MVNINYLRSQGVDAIFLPFGYSPFMTTRNNDNLIFQNKTVDFLFVGILNTRRQESLDPILNLYAHGKSDKTMVTSQTFKDDLDLAYAKSKVTLNIHYYEGTTILEVHRILPMVANRVWVLSEHSDDKWYDDEYSSVIDFVDLSGPGFVEIYQATIALEPNRFMRILDERLAILQAKMRFSKHLKIANTSAYPCTCVLKTRISKWAGLVQLS